MKCMHAPRKLMTSPRFSPQVCGPVSYNPLDWKPANAPHQDSQDCTREVTSEYRRPHSVHKWLHACCCLGPLAGIEWKSRWCRQYKSVSTCLAKYLNINCPALAAGHSAIRERCGHHKLHGTYIDKNIWMEHFRDESHSGWLLWI
jgi:hypothetical protein